jgi:OmpR family response regulator RpaB
MLGKRVLIVDDDSDLLRLLALVFAMEGARVYAAADGREGLRQFYVHQPDLVLLDVRMPMTDGRQVCHQIRQDSDVPVIMLTALEQGRDGSHILDCGANDYVTKPFETRVLLARAREALCLEAPAQKVQQVYAVQH